MSTEGKRWPVSGSLSVMRSRTSIRSGGRYPDRYAPRCPPAYTDPYGSRPPAHPTPP